MGVTMTLSISIFKLNDVHACMCIISVSASVHGPLVPSWSSVPTASVGRGDTDGPCVHISTMSCS